MLAELQLTVSLLLDDFLDVDAPFLPVNAEDLAFSALEGATHNLDGVTLSHGHCSDFVPGLEVLADVAAHDLSALTGRCGKVSLP